MSNYNVKSKKMSSFIHVQSLSPKECLRCHPTLYYGTNDKWFVVITPSNEVCAMALKAFPDAHRILKRFQKHTFIEQKIILPERLSCLLAGTPFQQQVWKALLDIPEGKTWSYQQLATYVKKPKAVRAVANAVGANPISPLIPCHRVIRSNQHIGGYFWGLEAKRALLKGEGVDMGALKEYPAKA